MNPIGTVNVDYVSVVRQDGELYRLDHVNITKPEGLLADLKEIAENQECTIFDLQSRMYDYFDQENRKPISYLFSSQYCNPHASWQVCFPKITEREEAHVNVKTGYLRRCIDYISAKAYFDTVDECKKDATVKLYSGAFCGCNSNTLTVNSDVQLTVTAQLGYSFASAYLGISLYYKNFLIEPYGFFVDNFRMYRKYPWYVAFTSPHTLCWDEIFQSAVDIANLAVTNPTRLYNEYVRKELHKMISGLTFITDSPAAFIDSVIDDEDSDIKEEYIQLYREYPDDFCIAMIADKLETACGMISPLTGLARIEPLAQYAVDVIKSRIGKHLPNIELYFTLLDQKLSSIDEEIAHGEHSEQDHSSLLQSKYITNQFLVPIKSCLETISESDVIL